jgi:ABC-type branched-subunit amino acid transport system substrate-binding protein/mono/diheme cytochrome c family protein
MAQSISAGRTIDSLKAPNWQPDQGLAADLDQSKGSRLMRGRSGACLRAGSVLAGLCILLCWTAAVAAGTPSDEELRGRELFLTGQEGEQAPSAVIGAGDVKVAATAVPCASCHGRDGRGRTERGFVAPDITWQALALPHNGDATSARRRPAYTEPLLIRAITMGIDAGGSQLDPVMPRFALSLHDAAALVAYLKRLGTLPEPGVDGRSLTLGTALGSHDAPVRLALTAYLDEINRKGGLFGRQLVLRVEEPIAGETPGGGVARLVKSGTVFALLAPMIDGDERMSVAAADADGVPMVGPLTPRAQSASRSRYVFYMNGGVEAEARALAGFASEMPGSPTIVEDGSPLWHAAAVIAAVALADISSAPPPLLRLGDMHVPAALAGNGPVLWFADGVLARRAIGKRSGTQPALLLPSALAADLLANRAPVPTYVAFTTGPADITAEAASEYRALAARHDLPAQDKPAQRQALAAAKVIVEALQRAGRDVTRERLVDALESLQGFRTGLMAPVSFSSSRRIGTDGVWIVPLDSGTPVWWDK